jgi:outer membrane protein assembly factor BamD
MIALSYYNQIVDVRRDQSITVKAKRAFQDVLNRYPNGQYATDAKLKMDLVNSNLAGKEMEIGRYYLNKMEWVAAINRFKTVAQDYQTTPHVQEALYRLVEAYLSLGITKEARSAAAVLGHNYPQSKWYRAAYELLEGNNLTPEMQEGSWFSKVF